jgi:hypothetical protein
MKSFHLLGRLFVGLTIAFSNVGSLSAWEPIFEGLGSYSRPVTTESPQARRYFNQGLAFVHGFNHGAAIRSFQEAARLDPKCAMAHWGVALASGPHINFPMVPPPTAKRAWKELQLAQQNADKASPVERALIEALGHRYANPAERTGVIQRFTTPPTYLFSANGARSLQPGASPQVLNRVILKR